MATLPAIFVGHGNPMNALSRNAWTEGWAAMGSSIPRPRSILAISAHWYGPGTRVTAMDTPPTIHDFGGFPRELFAVSYPAPGDPVLARRVAELLAPVPVDLDVLDWGLDHGTWAVLCHIYKDADVPVVQLSIDAMRPPQFHYEMGRLLGPLRDEGVLIIGSGSFTHDLSEFRGHGPNDPAPAWVDSFSDWFDARLTGGRVDELLDYRRLAPFAAKNHPTEEHLLPLYVALGAAGKAIRAERLHASATYSAMVVDMNVSPSSVGLFW